MYEAVQRRGKRRAKKGELWDYWLSEYSYCGGCTSPVCGGTAAAGQQKRNYTYPYYRCEGTLPTDYRTKICDLRQVRAYILEPKVDFHLREVVRNPAGILEGIRKGLSGEDPGRERRISTLEEQLRKQRLEVDRLTIQWVKENIDEDTYERLLAPMRVGTERVKEDLALLLREKRDVEDFSRIEEAMGAVLSRYRENLHNLGRKSLEALMRLLGVRLTMMPGKRVLVTGVIDPGLLTIGRTSACSPNWDYTVILKPNPSKWPAVKPRSGRRKRPAC